MLTSFPWSRSERPANDDRPMFATTGRHVNGSDPLPRPAGTCHQPSRAPRSRLAGTFCALGNIKRALWHDHRLVCLAPPARHSRTRLGRRPKTTPEIGSPDGSALAALVPSHRAELERVFRPRVGEGDQPVATAETFLMTHRSRPSKLAAKKSQHMGESRGKSPETKTRPAGSLGLKCCDMPLAPRGWHRSCVLQWPRKESQGASGVAPGERPHRLGTMMES